MSSNNYPSRSGSSSSSGRSGGSGTTAKNYSVYYPANKCNDNDENDDDGDIFEKWAKKAKRFFTRNKRSILHVTVAIIVILLFIYMMSFLTQGMPIQKEPTIADRLSSASSELQTATMGETTEQTNENMAKNALIGLFSVVVLFIVVVGLLHLLGYDLIENINKLFLYLFRKAKSSSGQWEVRDNNGAKTPPPPPPPSGPAKATTKSQDNLNPLPSSVKDILSRKQVFNIPKNMFDYDDARNLCAAYGARLATYDELEDTYNDGGEWCNYGWSEDQMILYPTQKKSWDKLQTIQGHENDCGRPGVNGGHMVDKSLKFGVNCYGNKPRITDYEEKQMELSPYPKSNKEINDEARIKYWKSLLPGINVSPYNHDMWSKGL